MVIKLTISWLLLVILGCVIEQANYSFLIRDWPKGFVCSLISIGYKQIEHLAKELKDLDGGKSFK